MATEILFHLEEGGTLLPENLHAVTSKWIESVIVERGGQAGAINYIFCGDDYLLQMNVEYLNHDTLTDIITFPYEHFPLVSGDLFISTERVTDNATDRAINYSEELHRVIIHGVLHLCGQGDKTEQEAEEMRQLEDWALSLRPDALL
ncbi:rRNA maturation RNase YbeY [Neolewinella persica]|uniref:rRNA maturation RNase YbeY n=1 Tax=Neolewinella persica TaxID=70998 RepID=UPI00035E8E56|nr:rRNA maturation RNase YbeY [Neolewinella persica]